MSCQTKRTLTCPVGVEANDECSEKVEGNDRGLMERFEKVRVGWRNDWRVALGRCDAEATNTNLEQGQMVSEGEDERGR